MLFLSWPVLGQGERDQDDLLSGNIDGAAGADLIGERMSAGGRPENPPPETSGSGVPSTLTCCSSAQPALALPIPPVMM